MLIHKLNAGPESNAVVGSEGVAGANDPYFYYFAYGSCMCPVDLKRSLGEQTHHYVLGSAILRGYRLGFHSSSTEIDVRPEVTFYPKQVVRS